MTGKHSVYLQAKRYVDAGLSVLPITLDGSKGPLVAWESYKTRIASDDKLREWFFKGQAGIAIIGGVVSGNLERIDFDRPGIYAEWEELARACEFGDLIESLPLVETPRRGSGFHLYYRCAEPVEGNTKLARYTNADGKIEASIETRGEAGYTIAPGSPAAVHEIKQPYTLARGSL